MHDVPFVAVEIEEALLAQVAVTAQSFDVEVAALDTGYVQLVDMPAVADSWYPYTMAILTPDTEKLSITLRQRTTGTKRLEFLRPLRDPSRFSDLIGETITVTSGEIDEYAVQLAGGPELEKRIIVWPGDISDDAFGQAQHESRARLKERISGYVQVERGFRVEGLDPGEQPSAAVFRSQFLAFWRTVHQVRDVLRYRVPVEVQRMKLPGVRPRMWVEEVADRDETGEAVRSQLWLHEAQIAWETERS